MANRKMDIEFDLYFRIEPEDEVMETIVTIYRDKRAICYGLRVDQAMEALKELIEEEVERA